MKLSDLSKITKFQMVQKEFKDQSLKNVYTSDLLSDVMANAKKSPVLITIQAHKNTVAVAALVSSPAIIICNDRNIPEDMLSAAQQEKIAVFKTKLNQFEASVLLNDLLKK